MSIVFSHFSGKSLDFVHLVGPLKDANNVVLVGPNGVGKTMCACNIGYTRFDLDEYKHAISVLKEYLSGNPKELSESDARIYLFYLREQHEHKFVKVAEEVDDEYKGGEV